MTDATDRVYERLLVLRWQTGDGAAFTELVARYQPRLRYYLRRMLPDPGAADDALQEVWLAAARAVSRLADPGAFRGWVYRIARDRAAREFRRRPPPTPLGDFDPADDRDEEPAFTAEDAARVHAALGELAPEHREVLVFRYVESMAYDEIARVAGCQVGTVRSRLHYAKRALRGVLERTDRRD